MRPIFFVQLRRLMFDIRFKNSRTKSVNSKSTCEIFHNKNMLLIRTDIDRFFPEIFPKSRFLVKILIAKVVKVPLKRKVD